MLLEAIHVDCWFAYAVGWAAYAVVMNVHYILIVLVKMSFLIPNKSYQTL